MNSGLTNSRAVLALIAATAAIDFAFAEPAAPTFFRDVLPILQENCQVCHRPSPPEHGGMVAPMAFTSFEDTRPWAKAIAKQVEERRMPPWHAAPEFHGLFRDERTLSEDDIATLVAWARGGARRGNPSDAPAPKQWPDFGGWQIGEPDLVIEMPEPYFVADDVEDVQVDVPVTLTSDQLAETRWIKTFEFKTGSNVVHHIQAPPFVGGAVPGSSPYVFPDGVGAPLDPGQQIAIRVHYHKEPGPGTGVWDRSKIGVKFYPRGAEIRRRLQAALLDTTDFEIPAGDPAYVVRNEFTFAHDSKIVHYLPHMHLRGVSALYEAEYPDGTRETLLRVPRYDFYWQHTYQYIEPKAVPAGTVVRFTTVYDNSAGNPRNPDPAATVHWGERSDDEMSVGKVWFISDAEGGPVAEDDSSRIVH